MEKNENRSDSQANPSSGPPSTEEELAIEAIKSTGLDSIFDVPLTVRVVLGDVGVTISDLLSLGEGSVLELDKLAGEPLDVFVKNQYVYKGEVVIVNDKYGIRLTDIISPLSM